jgi:carbamate kinase
VLTVVALGGNALLTPGQTGTAAEQRANLAATFAAASSIVRGGPVVITHGNGPQVGNELLRQEIASAEAPALPLYVAVAQTQAEIGALIASELEPVTGRSVAVVLTRVAVDPDDPAFRNPTKPVGPFYKAERARALESERGWRVEEDANRGWRRVVPSPRPLEVLELGAIATLLESGALVVAAAFRSSRATDATTASTRSSTRTTPQRSSPSASAPTGS